MPEVLRTDKVASATVAGGRGTVRGVSEAENRGIPSQDCRLH